MRVPLIFPVIVFVLLIVIGLIISCKQKEPPDVTIAYINEVSLNTASIMSKVTGDGGAEVTSRGICWSTSENPTIQCTRTSDGNGTGTFSSNISPLTPGTIYFVRAYATNSEGVGYSLQNSIKTSDPIVPPEVKTFLISFTDGSASVRGKIISNGGEKNTSIGICWSKYPGPDISGLHTFRETTKPNFMGNLPDLDPATKYYARAYARNSAGINYGEEVSFTTLPESEGTATDTDGNVYEVVEIGYKKWLSPNLRTTRYMDGTPIPKTDQELWPLVVTPAYGWYNNDSATYKELYGALYNAKAVILTDICPAGYHAAYTYDWYNMATAIDPDRDKSAFDPLSEVAGFILKNSDFNARIEEDGMSDWWGCLRSAFDPEPDKPWGCCGEFYYVNSEDYLGRNVDILSNPKSVRCVYDY